MFTCLMLFIGFGCVGYLDAGIGLCVMCICDCVFGADFVCVACVFDSDGLCMCAFD